MKVPKSHELGICHRAQDWQQ
jgi:hypothetical protein